MSNASYVNRGQFRPAGALSPDQTGMPNTPMLALIALLTPMTIWLEFSVVGRIFAPELILIGLLPFLLFTRGHMLMAPQPRMFLILVGQFSLLVRALHPDAQIVAFEPLPEAAARYRQVFHDDSRAVLHEAAISPARGTATMHVSAAADSSSLLPISERQSELFPGTQEVGTTDVEAGPLDAFVSADLLVSPAMLKIDVQGFELEVLRGSLPLLPAFAYVYVEASFEALYQDQALFEDVARFLEAEGYTEVGRYNMAHTAEGAPIQADFLFRRLEMSG